MKAIPQWTLLLLLVLLIGTGCKKDEIYTYGVNEVDVQQPGANKPRVKSDLEVISIAYTDLFGSTIDPDQLEAMSLSYQSFGDKRLVIDMFILNFLNEPNVQVPTDSEMRNNVDQFVNDAYERFFVREPSAFENWFVGDIITKNTDITPELVYYAFMTSHEYRYY